MLQDLAVGIGVVVGLVCWLWLYFFFLNEADTHLWATIGSVIMAGVMALAILLNIGAWIRKQWRKQ